MGLAAFAAAGTLALAACSSSSSSGSSTGSGGSSSTAGFNSAVTKVVNPSTKTGGTIVYDNSSGPDSTDAGQHLLRVQLELHAAVRDAADDLQVLHG